MVPELNHINGEVVIYLCPVYSTFAFLFCFVVVTLNGSGMLLPASTFAVCNCMMLAAGQQCLVMQARVLTFLFSPEHCVHNHSSLITALNLKGGVKFSGS